MPMPWRGASPHTPPGSFAPWTSGLSRQVRQRRTWRTEGAPGACRSFTSARIALVSYLDGDKRYVIATDAMTVGSPTGARPEAGDRR